jgi:hypothetical protein
MMTDMRRIRVFESRQWIMAFSAILLAWPVAGAEPNVNSASDQPPRKVIVGTVMRRFWGKHPGLEKRLAELTAIIDQMQAQSLSKYGRGLDLAVLPEMAVTGEGEAVGEVGDWSFPWEGPVKDAFVRAAREDHCYIVVPCTCSRIRPGSGVPTPPS